jgi:hypothetical protein
VISEGKWSITVEEWPWDNYPPYLFGPAVLLHGSTIVRLLAAFQTTPMISFDDLYYTGICAEKAGVKVHYSSDSTSNHRFVDTLYIYVLLLIFGCLLFQ